MPMRRPRIARTAPGPLPQILAGKLERAGQLDGIGRQRAHDRPGERGLARSGFADQPDHLAPRDPEVDAVECADGAGSRDVVERVALDREDVGLGRHQVRGLRASRNPSPSRLKPIATSAIDKLGQRIIQGEDA